MAKDGHEKHVYIFGNKHQGFIGYTFYKDLAKSILENRKHLKMFKIKNDKRCRRRLTVNNEYIQLFDDVFMTCDEEQYYLESFDQFKLDSMTYIDILYENINKFRFTDEEKHYIKYLMGFLIYYKNYVKGMLYEYNDDYYDEFDDSMFNNHAAAKWFVKEVLDK